MSAPKSHLWREETFESSDSVTLRSVFEGPSRGKCELWFKIPTEYSGYLTESFDPFAIANVFLIMGEGVECKVHDTISPSLLRNLSEFQAAWSCWRPEKYKQVEITTEGSNADGPEHSPERSSVEQQADRDRSAIQAFSGGIDSTFTAYRHHTAPENAHWKRNIKAGLFVHGFDIPLEQEDAFSSASQKMKKTLSTIGVDLITMSTNLQSLNIEWDDTHIAGLASSLMLFQRKYSEGLIASGSSYHNLLIPWGSNPITDHLLSSSSFQIIHDGAAYKRVKKREAIADWKQGYNDLRICFSADRRDENCGKCSKCLTDILYIRAYDFEMPISFPIVSDDELSRMTVSQKNELIGFEKLVEKAKQRGRNDSWLDVVESRMKELRKTMDGDLGSPTIFSRLRNHFRAKV